MSAIRKEVVIGDCRADGCQKKASAKGYCDAHYRRFKNYGDPFAGKTPNGAPIAFLKAIQETDACIEWPFVVNPLGYGEVRFNGKMMNAHRASLIIHCGPPPAQTMHAAHEPLTCHNRRCVNPKHLRWATPKSNMQDRNIDGTGFRAAGELHGASKLTTEIVEQIRRNSGPQKEVAEQFGISKQQVSKIIRRERWQHV